MMRSITLPSGADWLETPRGILIALAATLFAGLAIARLGMLPILAFWALPVVAAVVLIIFRNPQLGLYATMIMGFLSVGMRRYVPAPTGLAVDGFLAITLLVVIFRKFHTKDWDSIKIPVNGLLLLWFFYNVAELANPEMRSAAAWFYAVRGVALYMIIAVPLAILLFNSRKDLDRILLCMFSLSLLGTLWGLKQLYIGLDAGENAWLSVPGNQSTHVLFGKLRVFSYYSDAGQFGASQAAMGVIATVIALGPGKPSRRIGFAAVGLISFYGMLISGTRGAIVIPATGFMAYFVITRNFKIVAVGVLSLLTAYSVLKYTSIGHGNYHIQRLRTALDSDNPSFQVRLENQKKLRRYLETRPFGGGVGSGGYWGMRFSPNTFLANLALDSWYVKIAAEQGPVGLFYYILMLLYILGAGALRIIRIVDPILRQKMMALFASMVGVAFASYGNQVFGQMPTGIIIYLSIAFIFISHRLDNENEKGVDNAGGVKQGYTPMAAEVVTQGRDMIKGKGC